MSKHHIELCGEANEAINAVFGDGSVDKATTKSSLEELASNIEMMIETLEEQENEEDEDEEDE